MRRFFSTSFITLSLLLSVAAVAPVAHAQAKTDGTPCDYTDAGTQDGIWQNGQCKSNGTYGFSNTSGDTAANVAANKAAADTAAAGTPTQLPPTPDATAAFGPVMSWIMGLFAWLVGVAALTLDNAVYFTVVTMGSYINKLSAIGVTWRILRDVGNILLIFGFLAAGISTILNVDLYGWGQKMLPKLIIAAVFINFSLFISEAVIDTGNLFATQFYTQINGGQAAGAKGFDPGFSIRLQNEGISAKLMSQLGLQTIYGEATRNKAVFATGNTWIIGFMGIILFLITAFVMFSLAFVLIARFVALVFVIILSPVGFAGLAVPKLSKYAGEWWDLLVQQTITAPVLLLLLYIALAVITDASFLTGLCTATDAANQTCASNAVGWVSGNFQGFASFILSFLVAMGLLLAVVVASKKLSAFGASWASQTAGKLTFGLTAAGMRSTVGWGSQRLSETWRNSRIGRTAVVGRLGASLLDRGANAKYDFRNTGALKQFPGGIDAGAGLKKGFRDWEKEKTKERESHAESLGQTKNEKVQQALAEQQRKREEEKKKTMEETRESFKEQNEKEKKDLAQKHKEALQPHADKVAEAQGNLAQMKSNQSKGATISDAEIKTAQQAVDAAQAGQKKAMEEQRKEQEDLAAAQKESAKIKEAEVKVQQGEIEKRQKEIDTLKRAPQEAYIKGLEAYIDKDKKGFSETGDLAGLFRSTVRVLNPKRNEKAIKNIRDNLGKSKSEKELERVEKLLKGLEKSEEEKSKPKEEKPKEDKPKEAPKPEADAHH